MKNIRSKKVTNTNEVEVKDLLQETFGGEWALHPNKYNCFDIGGKDRDGNVNFIEVKMRDSIYNDKIFMYIEADKVISIGKKAQQYKNKTGITPTCMLVQSIEIEEGVMEHLVYDLKDIYKSPKSEINMNAATSTGFNNANSKKSKLVHRYKKDSWICNLSTGVINPSIV